MSAQLRWFRFRAVLSFVILLHLGIAIRSHAAETGPNVLIFLTDDLGWGDVGFRGSEAKTATIDRLAKEGMTFDRFYAFPSCSPARAALLSGNLPHRLGIPGPVRPRDEGLPAETYLMSDAFRSAGYQTFLIGKWHLSKVITPRMCSFDHFYGFMGASVDYYSHQSAAGQPDWYRNGRAVSEDGYSTFLFADEAIELLDSRDTSKPFFLLMSMNAPHNPFAAPQEYLDQYQHLGRRGVYAAIIHAMDDAFHRVLKKVDQLGMTENTIVLFLSDNGAVALGDNGPFRGLKQTSYEGGIRVPLVAKWPGHIPPGTTSDQLLAIYDLFPTLARAANVELKTQPTDGVDLWDHFCGGKKKDRGDMICGGTEMAILRDHWKLLENTDGTYSLYDLEADPAEANDLSDAQPDVAASLRSKLDSVVSEWPPIEPRVNPRQRRGRQN